MLRLRRFDPAIVAFVLIALAGVVAADEITEAKIKKLVEKRIEVRSQILRLVTTEYQQGRNSFDKVVEAQASLLSARLDSCETKEQRIKIHDEMVKAAETSLELAKKHFEAGEATQADVLKGEAHLLEMQISLEKAKAAK